MLYDYRLDAFVATACEGSFTKAAQRLAISPTALLKQIKTLEAACGATLFVRSSKGTTLTRAGEGLLEDARSLMRLSGDALRRVHEAQGASEGLVRLGVSVLRPGDYVLSRWRMIHEALPGLRMELVSISDARAEYSELIANLGERVDIIIGARPACADRGVCNMLWLGEAPIVAVVSRANLLASRVIIEPAELRGRQVTMLRRGNAYLDAARDALEAHGVRVESADDFELSTFNDCARKEGILITNGTWCPSHPDLVMIPLAWDLSIPFGVLYPLHPSPPSPAWSHGLRSTPWRKAFA